VEDADASGGAPFVPASAQRRAVFA
jgi:hypothetical protein